MKIKLNECLGKFVGVEWIEDGEKMGDLLKIYDEVDYNNLVELIDELVEENILVNYYIKDIPL